MMLDDHGAELLGTLTDGAAPTGLVALMGFFWLRAEFRSLREAVTRNTERIAKVEAANE